MKNIRRLNQLAIVLAFLPVSICVADDVIRISASRGENVHRVLDELPKRAFILDALVDPSVNPGGNIQAVSAILLGWSDDEIEPRFRNSTVPHVSFELREGSGRASWEIWIDGKNHTSPTPEPKPAGWMDNSPYQFHNVLRQRDGAYPVRIVGIPGQENIILRFYVEHMDRPVAEHTVSHDLQAAAPIAITSLGGQNDETNTSTFAVESRSVSSDVANAALEPWEIVLEALDYERPELREVADAMCAGDTDKAKTLFLQHMRQRKLPRGPTLDTFEMHPNYRKIADSVVNNQYARLGWFDDFAAEWADASGNKRPFMHSDQTVDWAHDNGHLNRHFHWVALAYADEEANDRKYAKRFALEVEDWVTREPFFWPKCPEIGKLNMMDGTVFHPGYMNTSNIGRRCEMVWWYVYEHFRDSPGFNDDAHFAMLLGFLRQSRLIMNPTSFAVHDD